MSNTKIAGRDCTCHPDDFPPAPCPRKYALTDCRIAALESALAAANADAERWREHQRLTWETEKEAGAYEAAIDAAIAAREKP